MSVLENVAVNLICLVVAMITISMVCGSSGVKSPCEKGLQRFMLIGFCFVHGLRWGPMFAALVF